MKYMIQNKITGEFLDDRFIVTQDGKIAQWDESQGWDDSVENQSNYIVTIVETYSR